jgi:Holliday junction DNA helicase RuvB
MTTTTRPRTLNDFIGQDDVMSNLNILLESAKKRGVPVDHILFYGTPGVGKSMLSEIIANEMGTDLVATMAPAINTVADIVALILGMKRGQVLFIDEIHALSRSVEEMLYTAMQDHRVDVVFGTDYPQTIRVKLPPFTVVGATTRLAHVTEPLRARFGSTFRINYYRVDDLSTIITGAASADGIAIKPDGVEEIAKRSRGTPRIALKLLRRARDYAVTFDAVLNADTAGKALDKLGIDEKGLNADDRKYLKALCDKKVATGIESLASMLNEEVDTLEDVVEPYLLYIGMMARTSRGRMATREGYEHLGRGTEWNDVTAGVLLQ